MSAQMMAVFLWAMAQVETGGNPGAKGAAGERGAHQVTPMVRAEYPAGWTDAEVAEAHTRKLERALRRHGIEPTAMNIAMAWNAGLTATLQRRVPARKRDHAQRVDNLFKEAINQ